MFLLPGELGGVVRVASIEKLTIERTRQPKSSLVGNFDRNSKDNIIVARSHLVFEANLKDKFCTNLKIFCSSVISKA